MSDRDSFQGWVEDLNENYSRVRLGLRQKGAIVSIPDFYGEETEDLKMEIALSESDGQPSTELYEYSLPEEKTHMWHRFEFTVEAISRTDDSSTEDLRNEEFTVEVEIRDDTRDGDLSIGGRDRFEVPVSYFQPPHDNRPDSVDQLAAGRVVGLEQQKDRLTEFLRPTNEDWGLEPDVGIILKGPPGTGKTELAIEVCQELYGQVPVTISGPEILSRWVGESERVLRDKFEEARNHSHPVVFIDEIDAIARARSEVSQEHSAQIVAQLLVLLDGIGAKLTDPDQNRVKVIASTNISEVVDPALKRPGRLGNDPIDFSRPTEDELTAILHHYLERVRREGRLGEGPTQFVREGTADDLEDIVNDLQGLTGADIEHLVQTAVTEARDDDVEELEWDHIDDAVDAYDRIPHRTSDLTTDRISISERDPLVVANPPAGRDENSIFDEMTSENGESSSSVKQRTIDLGSLVTEGTDEWSKRIREIRSKSDDSEVFLYLENAGPVFESAIKNHPPSLELVQAIHTDLLDLDDRIVMFAFADESTVASLFPSALYSSI